MRRTIAIAIVAAITTACSSGSHPSTPGAGSSTAARPAATRSDCERTLLAGLTMRQKLAQLLTVGVTGADDAADVVRIEHIGGIFIGSWTDQAILTDPRIDRLGSSTPIPTMVTIDEEGGRVSRVKNIIGPVPSARVLARTMTPDQVYRLYLDRGRKLRSLGVTVDFAPDADVSSQPDDSVIGDRSFSADPETVTRYAAAVVRGLHDAGVGAVIKHFPGHGSGTGDSHKGPVTTPPLDALRQSDLKPFRALVDSGAAVMVGHLDVPGLTTPGLPASLSPQAMALLRNGTGYGARQFTGVIFTDDLGSMAAVTSRMGIADAVAAALIAGADNALWTTTKAVPRVLDKLEQAVALGKLEPRRVDDSVVRIARFKGAIRC